MGAYHTSQGTLSPHVSLGSGITMRSFWLGISRIPELTRYVLCPFFGVLAANILCQGSIPSTIIQGDGYLLIHVVECCMIGVSLKRSPRSLRTALLKNASTSAALLLIVSVSHLFLPVLRIKEYPFDYAGFENGISLEKAKIPPMSGQSFMNGIPVTSPVSPLVDNSRYVWC